jgi:hypothetical protein
MPASTVYTTSAIVGDFLPASQSIVAAGDFTRLISEASRHIDTRLASRYIPFNDTAGNPATPVVIQRICTRLVAADALRITMVGAANSELLDLSILFGKEAESALIDLRDGKDSVPEESSTQTLTPGTGGNYDVATYEAIVGVTNPVASGDIYTLLPSTVRVTAAGYTQYGWGEDFSIRFDVPLQKWVFVDHRNDFLSQSSVAKTISYDWSYERYTDFRNTGGPRTRRLHHIP